jgi:hypothetical protein
MNQTAKEASSTPRGSSSSETQNFIVGLWGVRYQAKDVSRSVQFYTQQLGLKLNHQALLALRRSLSVISNSY